MSRKYKIALVIIFLIFICAIVIKEIEMRPKLNLIKDVEKILKNIKNVKYTETIEIIIDNGYVIDDKLYQVDGKGVIFIEDSTSVMLSRDGMCAMKLPYSDDIMLQEEVCPNYRLVDGEKIVVED